MGLWCLFSKWVGGSSDLLPVLLVCGLLGWFNVICLWVGLMGVDW